jgi:two-component system C4-dicarboxylate transport response regulator DctD
VRELKAAAERFALGLPVSADDVPEGADGAAALPDRVAAFEARLIQAALETHGGNAQAAAADLGIPLRTLNEKIARHGLRGRGAA